MEVADPNDGICAQFLFDSRCLLSLHAEKPRVGPGPPNCCTMPPPKLRLPLNAAPYALPSVEAASGFCRGPFLSRHFDDGAWQQRLPKVAPCGGRRRRSRASERHGRELPRRHWRVANPGHHHLEQRPLDAQADPTSGPAGLGGPPEGGGRPVRAHADHAQRPIGPGLLGRANFNTAHKQRSDGRATLRSAATCDHSTSASPTSHTNRSLQTRRRFRCKDPALLTGPAFSSPY